MFSNDRSMRTLAIILACACAVILGAWSHGTLTGSVPFDITPTSCTTSTPITNGGLVTGCTLSALNSPNGWSIVSQSCSSCYSITSGGVIEGGSNAGNVGTETDTITVNASNGAGTSSNTTITINAYADGYVNAANCAVQHANFFTGYTGTTYATRPPWKVAGVDYSVGQNCNGPALADPATVTVPTGWTRHYDASHQDFTCTQANPAALSGIDFSLEGGWQILDSASCSGNVTITNVKMGWGSFMQAHYLGFGGFASGSENLTWTYSTIDGGCAYQGTTNLTGIFDYNVPDGALVFEHNWVANMGDQGIEMFASSGTTSTVLIKWNFFDAIGYANNSHNQWLSFTNSPGVTFSSATEDFNTAYVPPHTTGSMPATGSCAGGGTYASGAGLTGVFYHAPGNASTITAAAADYNTVAAPLNGYSTQFGDMLRADGPGSEGSWTVENNYIDPTGSFGYFTSGGVSGTKICTGNYNLITATKITGSQGGMTCN